MVLLDMSRAKRMRNIPVYYEELKKLSSVNLTDTAWTLLRDKSLEKGLSISEYIERWVREIHGG